jgi:hypothetical protein
MKRVARVPLKKTGKKLKLLGDMKNSMLFVAGAGGKIIGEDEEGNITNLKKSPRHFFQKHSIELINSPVRSLNGKNLTGGSGPTAKRVVALNKAIDEIFREEIEFNFFLASSSFGCRVIAHTISGIYLQGASKKKGIDTATRYPLKSGPLWGKDHKHLEKHFPKCCESVQPNHKKIKGIIFMGYPLHSKTGSRIDDLLSIPHGTKIMFITGTKDRYKNINFAKKIAEILPSLQCSKTCRLHIVQGGKHNPIDGATDDEIDKLNIAIQNFIEYCLSPDSNSSSSTSNNSCSSSDSGSSSNTKQPQLKM